MIRRLPIHLFVGAWIALARCFSFANAENGYEAWLRYPKLNATDLANVRETVTQIAVAGTGNPILGAATEELQRGCSGLLGRQIEIVERPTKDGAVVIRTEHAAPGDKQTADGFSLKSSEADGHRVTLITGDTDRGTLYGTFAFLRRLQTRQPIKALDVREAPAFSVRMANQWDNPGGTIERGYGGSSVFNWKTLPTPDPRHKDLARMLSSVGIRALCINNVNADSRYLTKEYLGKISAVASEFRPYGIQLFIATPFDAPKKLGGLSGADPLDPAVQAWWATKADEVYQAVPDLGGFLIKADSEGRPGPYAYGRNHAQGANAIAAALRPHKGVAIWRAFVYKNSGDDRLKSAFETFKPLDGHFDDNVILQVKYGPLDFQVREPISPLFGAMQKTNVVLEVQCAQEYTGHDIHLCYLAPMWNEVLHFDTHLPVTGSTVGKLLSAQSVRGKDQGIAAVTNLGDGPDWAGNPMAMSNVYAIGRLSWNPSLSPEQVADEWVRMTFGNEPAVVKTIVSLLMDSRTAYESYTSSLGLGVLHDTATHFSPSPQTRFRWHNADKTGVGYDRTVKTGSGFIAEYADEVARKYEDPATTPQGLLLYFHHLPYTYVMNDGRTLIQTIYDLHKQGAETARGFVARWEQVKAYVDPERYSAITAKFKEQSRQADLWRDSINNFFQKQSGIPDQTTK